MYLRNNTVTGLQYITVEEEDGLSFIKFIAVT